MSVFTRPLVALALSEADGELLRYASTVLRPRLPDEVRFAHVLSDRAGGAQPDELESLRARMEASVKAHFDAPGTRVAFDVLEGSRLDELLALAAARAHDVILLGHRRGRTGRRSLARRLAMLAPCSVWLAPEGAPCACESILVPVDFSQESADALSLATRLASARGAAECRAVHVLFDPSTLRYDEHLYEVLGREQAAFDEMLSKVDCHGIDVGRIVEEGAHPAEAILRVAERNGSDLIVMSTRGRSRAAAVLLGSVASETLAATTIPLLAVKHYGSRMTLTRALLDERTWQEDAPKTN